MTFRKRTLMLVEDNRDDRELILAAFKVSGLVNKIVVAKDGEEAVDLLFQKSGHAAPETPSMILLDLKIPKISGLELLKKIKEDQRTRMIPVVVFTSSREERDLLESYGLGANSYVQKPIEFDEFERAVRRVEEYWTEVNQLPMRGGEI